MNSQICFTLQKIILSKQIDIITHVGLYILTDSGFQHLIQNRSVNNGTVNLFNQKLFLPYSTKQMLFQLINLTKNQQNDRICGFYYQIEQISLNSKRKNIAGCSQQYNNFQLTFSYKIFIELDTQTVNLTESEISELLPSSYPYIKTLNSISLKEQQNQPTMISKIYSPKNISTKFIQFKQQQSWQVKSCNSPSKYPCVGSKLLFEDQVTKNNQKTFESMTVQSVSIKKRLPVSKSSSQINQNEHFLREHCNNEDTYEVNRIQGNKHQNSSMESLIKFRNYILMGGIFGIFSAIISNELLIF